MYSPTLWLATRAGWETDEILALLDLDLQLLHQLTLTSHALSLTSVMLQFGVRPEVTSWRPVSDVCRVTWSVETSAQTRQVRLARNWDKWAKSGTFSDQVQYILARLKLILKSPRFFLFLGQSGPIWTPNQSPQPCPHLSSSPHWWRPQFSLQLIHLGFLCGIRGIRWD